MILHVLHYDRKEHQWEIVSLHDGMVVYTARYKNTLIYLAGEKHILLDHFW